MRSEALEERDETHYWMLVRKGLVQRLKTTVGEMPVKAWPVFDSQADATRYLRLIGSPDGVRPAAIGSVDGETLAGHISLAISDGCDVMCYLASWESDGQPRWDVKQI